MIKLRKGDIVRLVWDAETTDTYLKVESTYKEGYNCIILLDKGYDWNGLRGHYTINKEQESKYNSVTKITEEEFNAELL